MRLIGLAFMLAIHAIFIAGSAFAFFGYMEPENSWGRVFYVWIVTVLGLPWSLGIMGLGILGLDLSAAAWLAVVLNYVLLSWISIKALNSAWRKHREGSVTDGAGMTISTFAIWGILIPVLVFAASSLLMAFASPVVLYFSVAAVPGVAVANWWILSATFRTRIHLLACGLMLPLVAVLLEVIWLFNADWLAVRVSPLVGWVVVLLFLSPLILSFVFFRARSGDPGNQGLSPASRLTLGGTDGPKDMVNATPSTLPARRSPRR